MHHLTLIKEQIIKLVRGLETYKLFFIVLSVSGSGSVPNGILYVDLMSCALCSHTFVKSTRQWSIQIVIVDSKVCFQVPPVDM